MSAPQSALVTGASEGLGFHLARELAARGHRLTVVGRRENRLRAVLAELKGAGHDLIVADLSDTRQLDALIARIGVGRWQLLVNCAGASRFGALEALSGKEIQSILELNLVTPALLSRAFVAAADPGAMVVNVTSIIGSIGVPGNSVYCAAKAGLQALTECLWYEAARRSVTVLDFRPVSIATEFHRSAGGASLATKVMSAAPERAATALANAIARRRGFIYLYGRHSRTLLLLQRLLPKRWLIRLMARRAKRAGYI